MVECSPSPEGGTAVPQTNSSGSSLKNGPAIPGAQIDFTSITLPHENRQLSHHQLNEAVSSKTSHSRVTPFNRSNSDGSIGVSLLLPSTAKVHPGRFFGAEEYSNSKGKQKRELLFGDSIAIQVENEARKLLDESDTFLSASMQLMHLNGEARKRVRQLWTSVQRLGRDNQISEAGMDLLYTELSNILKNMSAEKLEATPPLKSGCLVLLASSPASDPSNISSGAAVKALFGSRPTAQLMRCSLSEDMSKFEMTPVRQDASPTNPTGSSLSNGATSTSSRFGLPTTASLMGMISEAFQEEPTTRVIRLQGCQVRRLVPKALNNESSFDDGGATVKAKMLHRFQLLVPYKTQISAPSGGVRADILFPTRAPVPYESFIFEVPVPGSENEEADIDAQAEVDDWVWALDRIVKDLGRDKVLLDDQLFSATNSYEGDDMESDSVSEVVKYMVKKVLEFEQDVASQNKDPGKTGISPSHQPSSPAHRFAKNCEARALAFIERVLQGSSRTQSGGDIYDAISFFCQQEQVSICPVSQDARPVQMRLITDSTKGILQVEVQVCMQFKVIELTPRSPAPATSREDGAVPFDSDLATLDSSRDSMREWAVLEGTLLREFTLGKLAAPGAVTINYISSSDN
ncbi:unnamed protein product [Phytophthora fragariaefolia]|uniref:Unnamed protein product n=1 Tax=Phytophthora fragariaefolia TaxID=1490495 RepID=A0A9W6UAA2_9STRA|nr:unnamed protein product [Phytophthora fragariaefolia]